MRSTNELAVELDRIRAHYKKIWTYFEYNRKSLKCAERTKKKWKSVSFPFILSHAAVAPKTHPNTDWAVRLVLITIGTCSLGALFSSLSLLADSDQLGECVYEQPTWVWVAVVVVSEPVCTSQVSVTCHSSEVTKWSSNTQGDAIRSTRQHTR